ncbi:unnamed protein product [Acanthosepion pharaonis]|uniref:Uncharacterized protein n=1 Tax=Acanthosepion pharaonis TaxID=158019 RepID=A0A812CY82_ACAPH|nr:unnamed protein product [Sepia pharaonis]
MFLFSILFCRFFISPFFFSPLPIPLFICLFVTGPSFTPPPAGQLPPLSLSLSLSLSLCVKHFSCSAISLSLSIPLSLSLPLILSLSFSVHISLTYTGKQRPSSSSPVVSFLSLHFVNEPRYFFSPFNSFSISFRYISIHFSRSDDKPTVSYSIQELQVYKTPFIQDVY